MTCLISRPAHLIQMVVTMWTLVQGVLAKAALAPGLQAAVARAMEVATAAPEIRAVAKATGMERGHLATQGGDRSFHMSARISMVMAPIPMTSIRRHGCRSRIRPSP